MINACWQKCVICLREELPAQQFNTWIKPLRAAVTPDTLCLFTPNRFILDWVNEHFLVRIKEILKDQAQGHEFQVKLEIGSPALAVGDIEVRPSEQETSVAAVLSESRSLQQAQAAADDAFDILLGSAEALETLPARQIDLQQRASSGAATIKQGRKLSFRGELNPNYTFSNFIQGKSNQLARAAASQVASNPGGAYNPLFIYGGVGLGKTHLMHAIGNHLRETNPSANVVYLHSQTFVGSMVSALQLNAINEFKRYYHSVDALLIDDIQFFGN